jgi:nitrogen fixation protein FixH
MMQNVDSKPIDRWLPWLFVLFFVVVLAVNAVMVYFAAASWTGLQTGQSYTRGLEYNRTLAEIAHQKALGWTATLALQPDAHGVVNLDLTLTDAREMALAGARVTARFVRPTSEGYDFQVAFGDYGKGRYRGVAHAPMPGQWDVYVVAEHPSGVYQITRRIMVP